MPPRIAAPFASCCPSLSGRSVETPRGAPANDNRQAGLLDPLVLAALRHFGAHGLDASRDAGRRAEAALLSGERQASRHWLEIRSLLGGQLVPPCDPHPEVTS